jgi:predicted nucleic acid-binding protein
MTTGLADTSFFIAIETGRDVDLDVAPPELSISVITVGVLRSGVLSASDPVVRDKRLRTLTRAAAFEALPIDEGVADAWALLRLRLRDVGRRMPVNDSWIAATAIAHGYPVVTRDADYDDVPGLTVLRV